MELLSVVRSLQRACRLLLHAVRRHLPGSERASIRGSHSEDSRSQDIALAVQGPRTTREVSVEWAWRERLMNHQRTRYMIPQEDYQTHK